MNRTIRKARRWFTSAAAVGIPVLALCIALLSIFQHPPKAGEGVPFAGVIGWGLFVFAACFWAFQTWTEYIRRTNDPTWILKYQETWIDAVKARKRAAQALLENWDHRGEIDDYETQLDPVEDVLDILEDVGFYVQTDQISAEVAHHHLYHWIVLWWLGARPYIIKHREYEPARWNHLETLYDETSLIEAKRSGIPLEEIGEAQLKQYLEEERDLPTEHEAEPS